MASIEIDVANTRLEQDAREEVVALARVATNKATVEEYTLGERVIDQNAVLPMLHDSTAIENNVLRIATDGDADVSHVRALHRASVEMDLTYDRAGVRTLDENIVLPAAVVEHDCVKPH
jgi:hypothetical protein